MKFLFWADKEDDRLAPLLESATANDFALEAIGASQIVPNWHHSLFKQRALFDAVREMEDREIVCATDGFDVFFQQGADYIETQFLSFGSDVVFSAERAYTHQYRRFKRFYDREGSSPYRYLNAGGVIGYAAALRELYRPSALLRLQLIVLRISLVRRVLTLATRAFRRLFLPRDVETGDSVACLMWFEYTDQGLMGRHLARGRPGISIDLDRECRLFWCTAFEWEDIDAHYEIVGNKIRNRHTSNAPACIHVPWESRFRAVFVRLYESIHGE